MYKRNIKGQSGCSLFAAFADNLWNWFLVFEGLFPQQARNGSDVTEDLIDCRL